MELLPFLNREEFAFLHRQVLGNELFDYLLAAAIFFIGLVLNRVLTRLVSRLLFRVTKRYTSGVTEAELHDLLIQPLRTLLYLATIYLSFSVLRYPMPPLAVKSVEPWPKMALLNLFHLGIIATIVWVVLRLVDFGLLVVARRTELTTTDSARRLDNQFLPFAKDLVKVFVILLGIMVMLGRVFGVNVVGFVGTLGIGGWRWPLQPRKAWRTCWPRSPSFSTSLLAWATS